MRSIPDEAARRLAWPSESRLDSSRRQAAPGRYRRGISVQRHEPLKKEYATREIVVSWEPALCQHSERCWRGLPLVFDPKRRPWVDVAAATADEIEAQVARCPSRALKSWRPTAGD